MNRLTIIMILAAALSGCAFDGPLLANRVTCTAAKDKAFVVSEWGPVGIASTIADADRQVICK